MRILAKDDAELIRQKAGERIYEILSQKNLHNIVTFSSEIVEHIPLDVKTGKYKLILPYKDSIHCS